VAFGFIETRLTQTFASEVPEIEIGERKFKVGLDAAQVEAVKRLIPLGRAAHPRKPLARFCSSVSRNRITSAARSSWPLAGSACESSRGFTKPPLTFDQAASHLAGNPALSQRRVLTRRLRSDPRTYESRKSISLKEPPNP
jgi:hypothetical protein